MDDLHRMDAEGPTWAGLRALYASTDTPGAWGAARARMLGVLEWHLGARWPARMWRRHGIVPLNIVEAASNNLACAALLELAFRLELHQESPGFANLRKMLRREATSEAGAHVRLQLEVASLTSAIGTTTHSFEQQRPRGGPIDVLLARASDHNVAVETCTLFTDEAWRLASAYNQGVSQRVVMAGIRNEVSCRAEISAQMSPEETNDWLERVDQAAGDVAAGGASRVVRASSARAVIGPREVGEQGRIFQGPTIEADSWPRILRRMLEKIVQTEGDTETWIRLDLLDGTWQFTPWSLTPLSEKVAILERTIASAFPDPSAHLGGIVVSNGAGYGPPELGDESHTTPTGATAIRRRLWPLRVRETLILPISPLGRATAGLFRHAYHAEPAWLDQALVVLGLEPLSGLWAR